MLSDFYGAFAPVSFTLLGLWFIVVQTRHGDWARSGEHRRRTSTVSLHFALPGMMSLLSLIDPASRTLWRTSFSVAALVGATSVVALRAGVRIPGESVVSRAVHWIAVALYLGIALIAVFPTVPDRLGISMAPLRVEALLLSLLVFLGVTVAWLLMFDQVTPRSAGATADPGQPVSPPAER